MPRPQKKRLVNRPPLFTGFKPRGIPSTELANISLDLDELEAVRLADHLGLDHAEAAEKMGISRSTFSRLVERARSSIARFLIEGMELEIGGGDVHFRENLLKCKDCGHFFENALENEVHNCPECGSGNIKDIALSLGHGKCCSRHLSENRDQC